MRAGLIPSRALQEGRIIHERQTDPQTMDGKLQFTPDCTANSSDNYILAKSECSYVVR